MAGRYWAMAVLWVFGCHLFAAAPKIYITKHINPESPVIDGRFDDPTWEGVQWEGGFIQYEPHENRPPSQNTEFKILYDEENLYIAIRAHDSRPDSIVRRLTRRDEMDGDLVAVQIDSYHDHLTAFTFYVNVSGVKVDGVFSNDGENEDYTWDPVWFAETSQDEGGWSAEIKIPCSQLRFGDKEEQIWGLQVGRYIYRKDELSLWQFIPKDSPGWVHQFGELHGIRGIRSSRRIELLPYAVGQLETMEQEAWNPFLTGHAEKFSAGLDGKIGVTSDLTMDFTIHPDFGQVEADPSVVNLTAFETFFEEKRPFFIEGANILNYQIMIGDGDLSNDNLFYSRRIGRPASYYPELGNEETVKMPESSSILTAMKLTGKTKSGLSIAVMDAVTSKEFAEIDYHGHRREVTAEPMANFFLGRMQRDFRGGATSVGAILTHTYRDIQDSHLDFLNRNAFTGGFDFSHEWKDRTYLFSFKSVFSHIQGDPEAMVRAQSSPVRYFQRPDAEHVLFDSSRTSLSGHGGSLLFGKLGSGHWQFLVGGTWRSPGLELNDMGYMRQADLILEFVWASYRIWEPFSIFRSLQMNFNQWSGWNFGKENTFNGGNVNLNLEFANYWGFGTGVGLEGEALSSSALRGGPSLLVPGGWNWWYNIRTDGRKAFVFGYSGSHQWASDGFSRFHSFRPSVTWRPSSALSIGLNPFYTINRDNLQYVDQVDYDAERYLFGAIHQETVGLIFRMNYSLTPELSIQYYGQPFVSAGSYSNYKRITDPRAKACEDRFHEFTEEEILYDLDSEEYRIDEDSDGVSDYAFGNPDFNFREFRSNLVIRWEYRPGSTLYLVWSQGRTDVVGEGAFSWSSDFRDLFEVHPHDVFLVKFNHWFSL